MRGRKNPAERERGSKTAQNGYKKGERIFPARG